MRIKSTAKVSRPSTCRAKLGLDLPGVTALSLISLLLTACQSTGTEQEPVLALTDTRWQLVELQSMSDEIGISRPLDPAQYTMTLNVDGTVNLRLDCNRATGSWSAAASSEESGSFSFTGPLAMTRAMCPPGSLDERIAREAQYVRSYLLREGRLYLGLLADGGIQVWQELD